MVSLSGLDIILGLILFFFFTLGFVYGFFHALGLIAGIVVGLWAANQYFQSVAGWLTDLVPFIADTFPWLTGSSIEVISFILIGAITFKLIALAFEGLDHLIRLLYVIPFMKSLNRLLGAAIGLLEAVLILSLMIHFTQQVDFIKSFSESYVSSSVIAKQLLSIGQWIAPILPNALNYIASWF